MKSLRVSAAIDARVQNAENKIVSAKVPSWLSLSDDRKSFKKRQPLVDVVRHIFELCDKGMGDYSIARKLNNDDIKPFGRAEKWGASSIGSILKNQAVIVIWQPFKTINGKKIPSREAIPDYFPAIVDSDQFFSVPKG